MRLALRCLLLAAWALLSAAAAAHEMSMAELEVRQVGCNEFLWQWTASGARPVAQELTPVWPESCRAEANRVTFPISATNTAAHTGPIPGMAWIARHPRSVARRAPAP